MPHLRATRDLTVNDHGQLGYGYNYAYLSPQDGAGSVYGTHWTKLASVRRPAEKVAFADCTRNQKNAAAGFPAEQTPFLFPPSQQYPAFQGRHLKTGNVAWIDGHISVEVPKLLRTVYNINFTITATPGPLMPASYPAQLNIGDIDADGNPDTDELWIP